MSGSNTSSQGDDQLYKFFHANIHERRWAASIFRAFPLGCLIGVIVIIILGMCVSSTLLLVMTATLNVSMWIWISTTAGFSILGAYTVEHEMKAADTAMKKMLKAEAAASIPGEPVHVVVIPNYKEDEGCLTETLTGLAESVGSSNLIVCLAMEEREGEEARKKSVTLTERFAGSFADILVTFHPPTLIERHLDGSEDPEVAGKASNLKYAVSQVFEACRGKWSLDPDVVMLTIADADVLMHPYYFARISQEYLELKACPGEQHRWAMWQAPQFANRNYWTCPLPSRVWAYIASVYESGGCAGLSCGSHHMVFSAYSVPLKVAQLAQLWDGDVLAEDHHAFMKLYLYSIWEAANDYAQKQSSLKESAKEQDDWGSIKATCRPLAMVRPVMLPAKSISVDNAENYWQSWKDRWDQAYRHTMGIGEVSYSLLAVWDMIRTLPAGAWNIHLVKGLIKLVARPLCSHLLPSLQGICLALFTLQWFITDEHIPGCPRSLWFASSDGSSLVCGLAGAWALTWPIVFPFLLIIVANYYHLVVSFIDARGKGEGIWFAEDGQVPKTFGSRRLTLFPVLAVDIAICLGPIMIVYGLLAEALSSINVARNGNRFKYITASKGGPSSGSPKGDVARDVAASSSYGTVPSAEA